MRLLANLGQKIGIFSLGAGLFLLRVPVLGHILRLVAIGVILLVSYLWALVRVVGKIFTRKLRRMLFLFIKTRNFPSLGRVLRRVFASEFLKMDQKVPLYLCIDFFVLFPFIFTRV